MKQTEKNRKNKKRTIFRKKRKKMKEKNENLKKRKKNREIVFYLILKVFDYNLIKNQQQKKFKVLLIAKISYQNIPQF